MDVNNKILSEKEEESLLIILSQYKEKFKNKEKLNGDKQKDEIF